MNRKHETGMDELRNWVLRWLPIADNRFIIRSPQAIRQELIRCYQLNMETGIICPKLGRHICLGSVRGLHQEEENESVTFKWYDHKTKSFCTSVINLDDIIAVCPVNKGTRKGKTKVYNSSWSGAALA